MSMSDSTASSMPISKLKGLGPQSEKTLARIGVHHADAFLAQDPFELFEQLYHLDGKANLNLLYAMIGAQQGCHWQEVKQTQRLAILLRLEEMGIETA